MMINSVYFVNLCLLKYFNQEVVEEIVFRGILFTYLKLNTAYVYMHLDGSSQ